MHLLILLQRNTLHLDLHILWQCLHGHTTPGGLCCAGEVCLVHGVDAGKVAHVGEEDGGLDDLVESGAGGGEDDFEVVEGGSLLGGLVRGAWREGGGAYGAGLDVTFNHVSLAVGGDLAGAEDEAVGFDCLGLWEGC